MGTPSVTPTTPVEWVPTLTWFQKHERLILGTMVLGVVLFLGNRWLDKSAAGAESKAAAAATVAQAADASKKQADVTYAEVLTQANAQTALLQAQVASDKQTIASLVQSVASRDAASTSRLGEVKTSTTPLAVGQDFGNAYGVDMTGTPVTTDGRLSLTTDAVKAATVAKIEGDTAKADLKDTESELSTAQSEVTNDEGIIVEKDKIISQDAVTLKAHDDAATADEKKAATEIKAVKADARRGKWHAFWWGFAAGFLGREAIHEYSGH